MKAQGIRSLIASVSCVLGIALVISLGTQPVEHSAVPMASVGQPAQSDFVSTAAPSLPSGPDALSGMIKASVGLIATDGSLIPEEAPGEDTTVLTVVTVVPTASVPSIAPATVNPSSGTLLSMPLVGRKTSRFGMRFHPVRRVWKLHTGLDLAAPCGTPIGAAAAGTVVKAGWAGGNGVQVKVDHGTIAGHQVVTTYNHLSAIGVSVGQKVVPHQGVGRVGNTGFSTGCHLHFEVIVDGVFTNPEPWLNGSTVVVDTVGMGAGRPGEASPARPSLPPPSGPAASPTPSAAPTPSPRPTPSGTPSASASPTPSPTPSASVSPTPSVTPTPSKTPGTAGSPTPCVTPSVNADGTSVEDPMPCTSVTPSPTPSPENSGTPTPPPETPGEIPEIPENSSSPPAPGTPVVPTPTPTPTTPGPTPTGASEKPATVSPPPSTASATASAEEPPTAGQPSASEQESTPEA